MEEVKKAKTECDGNHEGMGIHSMESTLVFLLVPRLYVFVITTGTRGSLKPVFFLLDQ